MKKRRALYVYDAPHCRVKVLQGARGPTLTIRRANGDYVRLDEEITDLVGIAIDSGKAAVAAVARERLRRR